MNTKRFASARTCLSALLIVALCPYAVNAEESLKSYDIKAQSMDRALRDFAAQTEIQVAFSPDTVDGLMARAVEGDYAPESALQTLIDESGLDYEFASEKLVVVRALQVAGDERGDSDPKNSSPQPVLIAQNAPSQLAATTTNRSNDDSATSVVYGVISGKVVDARTGANLKGALVEIEETGQSTSTNDLGEFRFPAVVAGNYTLRVSYLGYVDGAAAIRAQPGRPVQQNIQLSNLLEEIVVFGQRSARAQSLNQERTALNSTNVLSADLLGQFNGTTISEAMRRAPGIAFIPDPNTGDGTQVIVRGLEPDLNQVTLNGIRLLDGTGLGRSPDLSSILTESIESVTINKSLLPSHDSNGAGALIEIETKSPLDRDERFASFAVEYGEAGGEFGDEFGANGTVSGVFGQNKDFGASLSVAYRERDVTRVSFDQGSGSADVEVLPVLNSAGEIVSSPRDLDPLRRFPFEPEFGRVYPTTYSANQGSSDQETHSIVGALQKQFGEHTDLRFDVVYTQDETADYNVNTGIITAINYDLAPVDSLNGEVRRVLVSEDLGRNDPDPFPSLIFGSGIPGVISRNLSLSPEEKATTLSLQLRGKTNRNAWNFRYSAGLSESKNEQGESYTLNAGNQTSGTTGFFPELISRDLLSEEALRNVTGDGRIISVFPAFETSADGDFLLPLFSEDGFAYVNSADNFPVDLRVVGPRESKGQELSLFGSVRREFESGFVKYLELGIDYGATEFTSPGNIGSGTLGDAEYENASGITASDLGLAFGPGILHQIGVENDLSSFQRGDVENFIGNIGDLVSDGLLVLDDEDEPTLFESRETTEDTFTGYIEARAEIDKLEFIGGVRVERIEVGSTFFTGPRVIDVDSVTQLVVSSEAGRLSSDSVSQTSILPRILANYRFSDNMLLRASYFTTVSRPQLSNLTDTQQIILRLDPTESTTNDRPVLEVRQGNPDLKPATTHSFDLGFEWYSDDIGVVKVGTFYKVIDNPLQNTRRIGDLELLPEDLVLPSDITFFNPLPDLIEINVQQPINGKENNEIYGVELAGERQFTFLPGFWGGFGVYSNYTYTDSKSVKRIVVNTSIDPRGFVEVDDVPFEGSPKHQGTFGLTYNKYNIDASLLYSAQDRRLASVENHGFDHYEESLETLDLRVDYFFSVKDLIIRLYLRGEDLLSGSDDAFLQTSIGGEGGVPTYYTGGTYFGGRAVFLGMSTTF